MLLIVVELALSRPSKVALASAILFVGGWGGGGNRRYVVGDRVRARDQYHEFLKCLGLFSQDIVGKQELTGMVQDIIGRYPDLMVSLCSSGGRGRDGQRKQGGTQ
jgi:hypothetical protein